MRKTDSLQKTNPKLAYRFLIQAKNLYYEKLNGYDIKIDKEFNKIFIDFLTMYPPLVNPKLI